jgi:soluble lytic murein transglycosylase
MDYLLYQEETNAAMRMAQRLGGHALTLAKARVAVINEAGNAGKLLDAVPTEMRHDPGYIFSRAQWLRRTNKIAEAGKVMVGAPRDAARAINSDEWWVERRLIARKLLDDGNAALAYQVARDGPKPQREVYEADQAFTAGWIALRFLNDPAAALQHFAHIPQDAHHNPAAQSRAGYWMGRAADALGRTQDAQRAYQSAAAHSTSYYGQLARARLGLPQLALNGQPRSRGGDRFEVVRAVELLYAINQRDFIVPMLTDLAQQTDNIEALVALAELTVRHKDPRGTLIVGKGALNRGLPFDVFAFPTTGVPAYKQVGPEVEDSLVYSIARQESMFNPKAISVAKAMGLMQVMPATGRLLAKKYRVPYDQKRMLTEPAFNASLGAAMLGELVANYRGSYILTSVGYNAGPGRVRDWVAKYGDPRDPKVDAVDWVERIPFAETRNYVQRIVENMQVYRARFGGDHRLMIEADLRRGTTTAQE